MNDASGDLGNRDFEETRIPRRPFDRGRNITAHQTNTRPTRRAQHHDSDASRGQILLIPEILVGRDHDRKSGRFRRAEQVAVREPRPATLVRRLDLVADQRAT